MKKRVFSKFWNFLLPEPRKGWEPQEPRWHRPVRVVSSVGIMGLGVVIAISSSAMLPSQEVAALPICAGLTVASVGFLVAVGAIFFHGE